jgi:hypothetical protein
MHFVIARAHEAPALARAMAVGQQAAMRPYGIDFIVNPDIHPEARLVAAELEPGVPAGGLRLELRTTDHRLQLEGEVELPEASRLKLEARAEEGLLELCGMWVAREARVPRLPDRLVRLGIALAAAEGATHMVALGDQHSLPLALRSGFHFEDGEPVFPFPNPNYRSRVVWLRLPRGY